MISKYNYKNLNKLSLFFSNLPLLYTFEISEHQLAKVKTKKDISTIQWIKGQ
jgi:hypothetical protein